LESHWEKQLSAIQADFAAKLQEHSVRTDTWIKDAAKDIFEELKKSPGTLNALRTARVGIDAGMIVFTLATAGHASLVDDLIHDAIIAPTLLAGTQAATEGLTEQYVEGRRKQLQDDLLADTQRFGNEVYARRLRNLSKQLIQTVGFVQVGRDVINSLVPRVEALAQAVAAGDGRV